METCLTAAQSAQSSSTSYVSSRPITANQFCAVSLSSNKSMYRASLFFFFFLGASVRNAELSYPGTSGRASWRREKPSSRAQQAYVRVLYIGIYGKAIGNETSFLLERVGEGGRRPTDPLPCPTCSWTEPRMYIYRYGTHLRGHSLDNTLAGQSCFKL